MKTKTFDCVEMKNRIQAQRYEEYLAHRDEYESYADFIESRAKKSAWTQEMLRRFGGAGPSQP